MQIVGDGGGRLIVQELMCDVIISPANEQVNNWGWGEPRLIDLPEAVSWPLKKKYTIGKPA